jgi:preprotein translocase subunit SecA
VIYLSLEDDLMRIFGSERVSGLMGKLGMDESQPIEHKWVSKAIENAQKKVEAHNFDIRKHLLEYDDVMNKQRSEIYSFRRDILIGEELKGKVLEMSEDVVKNMISIYCPEDRHAEEWDVKELKDALYREFSIYPEINAGNGEELYQKLYDEVKLAYANKEKEISAEALRYLEKVILLQVVDTQWKDHLLGMDHLKEGIGLRGYGQRDPLVEYKKEAYDAFIDLGGRIESEVLSRLFKIKIAQGEESHKKMVLKPAKINYNQGSGSERPSTVVKGKKIGRNEPCSCGSGKKYKKCCGMGK